ncbi:MAG: microcystin degradation protein MlrC [Robiginitomaculum sp.]|nr:MAG: microcystin degradation protein MlrC [Robiginitomaculum sp.]
MGVRILTAEIYHETNTFNIFPTDIADFENRYLLDGPAAIAARGDANTELAGVLDVAQLHECDITHVISASAGPGGRVTDSAFEALCAPLLSAAKSGVWDGVLLMLHGAMVTASYEDGEGEILRRMRAIVGPDLPIAVSLDPHANVTAVMCEQAQILVSLTTYPHVDSRMTGRRVAELLMRTISGEINPETVRAYRPMLEKANGGRTDIGPMVERQAMARAFEARKGVYAVSINGAFPCADIRDVGPTVLVTAEVALAGAQEIAEEIADDIWNKRADCLNTYLSVDEAALVARNWKGGSGPLIIADYADNPGAGAYGDSTALLGALLDADIQNACFGPLIDAEAAALLQKKSIGETVSLKLGGKTAPQYGGGPICVTGVIKWLGQGVVIGTGPIIGGQKRDYGATAVVQVGGIDILIVSIAHQMYDLNQFEMFGINPREAHVVGLKSMQHFRAAFGPIAGRIIVCDSGALCTVNYNLLDYQKVPRPIYPLDEVSSLSA